MRVRTKMQMLIGATVYPEGATVEVDDRIGRRLVESKTVEQLPELHPARRVIETAAVEPKREKAATRA